MLPAWPVCAPSSPVRIPSRRSQPGFYSMPSLAELLAGRESFDDIRRMGQQRSWAESQQELANQARSQRPSLAALQQPNYGKREDGTSKGSGYFGPLQRPDGGVSTELSFDFDHPKHGKVFAPLIVPGLSRVELNHLLADGKPTEAIYNKAQDFAVNRLQAGKSPFAMPGESYAPPQAPATLMDLMRRIAPAASAVGQGLMGAPIYKAQPDSGFMGVRG